MCKLSFCWIGVKGWAYPRLEEAVKAHLRKNVHYLKEKKGCLLARQAHLMGHLIAMKQQQYLFTYLWLFRLSNSVFDCLHTWLTVLDAYILSVHLWKRRWHSQSIFQVDGLVSLLKRNVDIRNWNEEKRSGSPMLSSMTYVRRPWAIEEWKILV